MATTHFEGSRSGTHLLHDRWGSGYTIYLLCCKDLHLQTGCAHEVMMDSFISFSVAWTYRLFDYWLLFNNFFDFIFGWHYFFFFIFFYRILFLCFLMFFKIPQFRSHFSFVNLFFLRFTILEKFVSILNLVFLIS